MWKKWTELDASAALRASMTIRAINRPIADDLHVKSFIGLLGTTTFSPPYMV